MKRRVFLLTVLGVPAVALAQGAGRTPKIGVLMFTGLSPQFQAAVRRGLKEHGYVEGRNIEVDWRAAEGSVERAEKIAVELVAAKVAAIVTVLTPAAHAARKASATIPIVLAVAGDPLATGLVKSLARPGGNITGMSSSSAELAGKRIELLREVLGNLDRIGVLYNGGDAFSKPFLHEIADAAKRAGVAVEPIDARPGHDMDAVFASLAKAKVRAVIMQASVVGPKSRVPELALRHRIPMMVPQKELSSGWLMAFGADLQDLTARSISHVDRILKGAKPGDLPIEQPTTMELVINRSAAKALGINLSQAFLARATLVVD
jgi:putative tryptophan/tyrosine transport system substrate-binding protein